MAVLGSSGITGAWLLLRSTDPQRGVAEQNASALQASKDSSPHPDDPVVPARFAWPPVPGANSYLFVLFRGGSRVYEVATPRLDHAVPLHWTFAGERQRLRKGTYRWIVVPRFGQPDSLREGDPVIDATYSL